MKTYSTYKLFSSIGHISKHQCFLYVSTLLIQAVSTISWAQQGPATPISQNLLCGILYGVEQWNIKGTLTYESTDLSVPGMQTVGKQIVIGYLGYLKGHNDEKEDRFFILCKMDLTKDCRASLKTSIGCHCSLTTSESSEMYAINIRDYGPCTEYFEYKPQSARPWPLTCSSPQYHIWIKIPPKDDYESVVDLGRLPLTYEEADPNCLLYYNVYKSGLNHKDIHFRHMQEFEIGENGMEIRISCHIMNLIPPFEVRFKMNEEVLMKWSNAQFPKSEVKFTFKSDKADSYKFKFEYTESSENCSRSDDGDLTFVIKQHPCAKDSCNGRECRRNFPDKYWYCNCINDEDHNEITDMKLWKIGKNCTEAHACALNNTCEEGYRCRRELGATNYHVCVEDDLERTTSTPAPRGKTKVDTNAGRPLVARTYGLFLHLWTLLLLAQISQYTFG